jgi:hypothetical protein
MGALGTGIIGTGKHGLRCGQAPADRKTARVDGGLRAVAIVAACYRSGARNGAPELVKDDS